MTETRFSYKKLSQFMNNRWTDEEVARLLKRIAPNMKPNRMLVYNWRIGRNVPSTNWLPYLRDVLGLKNIDELFEDVVN